MRTTKLNLTYSKETEKALLTTEFGWIPKSVAPLASSGQIHEVASWFVQKNEAMLELSKKQKAETKELFDSIDNWKDTKMAWQEERKNKFN